MIEEFVASLFGGAKRSPKQVPSRRPSPKKSYESMKTQELIDMLVDLQKTSRRRSPMLRSPRSASPRRRSPMRGSPMKMSPMRRSPMKASPKRKSPKK